MIIIIAIIAIIGYVGYTLVGQQLTSAQDEAEGLDDPYAIPTQRKSSGDGIAAVTARARAVVEAQVESLKVYTPDSTCFYCPDNHCCHLAFDHYNTNGDCLLEK